HSLSDWLTYLESLNPRAIALGLERVQEVKAALKLEPSFPIITVGGTNGKGSTCAFLESILASAGYRTGCYSSPHLLRYNERVRIGRRPVNDAALLHVFKQIEAARNNIPLTYFEYGTLAALLLFVEAKLDVAILEVGLGGRLDAVNAFDTDCALVTSVDFDHMDYLGSTREKIAFEKAGIFRSGKPALCAEPDPPHTLIEHAANIGARLLRIDHDFGYVAEKNQWQYWGRHGKRHALPFPGLRGACQLRNASAALAALDELKGKFPLSMEEIRRGLLDTDLPARFQVLPGRPVVILDVAHNPQAARALAENLAAMGSCRRTYAVFGMLKDKDIAGVASLLAPQVDHWMLASIHEQRGASAADLARELRQAGITESAAQEFADPGAAYLHACNLAAENDRIIVFGSFHTVAGVLRRRGGEQGSEKAD
ncbi:MAG: bifunctional tetrahydrofolate synthase/dihydrofolate synthase, partial [Burkholderiales bacterium]